MLTWKGIVGKSFTPTEFEAYVHTLSWNKWRPSFIVLHNMAIPSLAQRPDGLTAQHIKGLEVFYRDTQKWSAGPHLFVDDKQIWVFTPLTTPGVHSPSWNSMAIGIEMLGDFATESFSEGRGLAVRNNVTQAIASISHVLGIDPSTMKLHKEDKKTTHICPGKNVIKSEVIAEVTAILHEGEHTPGLA